MITYTNSSVDAYRLREEIAHRRNSQYPEISLRIGGVDYEGRLAAGGFTAQYIGGQQINIPLFRLDLTAFCGGNLNRTMSFSVDPISFRVSHLSPCLREVVREATGAPPPLVQIIADYIDGQPDAAAPVAPVPVLAEAPAADPAVPLAIEARREEQPLVQAQSGIFSGRLVAITFITAVSFAALSMALRRFGF